MATNREPPPVLRLALGVTLLCAFTHAQTKATRELFVDNGFESGMTGWKSLNMTGTLELAVDRKTKKAGKQALRITRGAGDQVDFVKQFAELSAAEGSVNFSIAYRVEGEGEVRIQVFFFDEAGAEVEGFHEVARSKDTKKKWVQAEKQLTVPSAATSLGLNIWALAPGTIWIDEVSALHDTPEPRAVDVPSLGLANADFEKDLSGWELLPFGSGTARAVRDTEKRSAGLASLRLERRSLRLNPEDEWRTFVTKSPRQRVREVELEFSWATQGAARASVHLQALTESGAVLASARSALTLTQTTFEKASLRLEIPPTARGIAVTLAIGGRGTVWLDALALKGRP